MPHCQWLLDAVANNDYSSKKNVVPSRLSNQWIWGGNDDQELNNGKVES